MKTFNCGGELISVQNPRRVDTDVRLVRPSVDLVYALGLHGKNTHGFVMRLHVPPQRFEPGVAEGFFTVAIGDVDHPSAMREHTFNLGYLAAIWPRGTPMMRVFTYNTATLLWNGVEPWGARLLARMTVGSP